MPPLNKFQKSCIALAVGQALVPTNLKAATITVNTPITPSGCTLYHAFDAANSNGNVGNCFGVGGFGNDTIILPNNTTFDLDNSATVDGLLVSSNITVQGNGSTIRRYAPATYKRLIDVTVGGNLNLNDIELRDGHLSDGQGSGAAVRVTSATLTTNSVTIRNNVAVGGSTGLRGGGISASDSTININYSDIRDNSVNNSGAGIFAKNSNLYVYRSVIRYNSASTIGGAIYADNSPLEIEESQLRSNSAGFSGGALHIKESDTTISNSQFTNNLAGAEDCCSSSIIGGEGAVAFVSNSHLSVSESSFNRNIAGEQGSVFKIDDGATLSVDKSSFGNNRVFGNPGTYYNTGNGGAISIAVNAAASHSIVNSTMSSNHAPYGGAILIGGSQLDITNTTIVGAGYGKYGIKYYGGEANIYGGEANIEGNAIFAYGSSSINMANSVVSHAVNRKYTYGFYDTALCSFNQSASLTSNIHNLFQDSTCDGGEGVDPRLAKFTPLYNSGTKYFSGGVNGSSNISKPFHYIYIPLFDSPLQNAGEITVCTNSPVDGVDLRNIPHAESHCDIGSIDSRNTIITVNDTGDEVADGLAVCTLRDALYSAQNVVGGGEFTPRPGSTCSYSYDQTTIRFDSTVFPSNSQTTINLANGSPLPVVFSPVSINGPSSKPSALSVMGGGNSNILSVYSGNLYMNGMTLSGGDTGGSGGAMSVYSSVVTLDRMTITGNTAVKYAGGLHILASSANITNSTISNNSSGASVVSPRGGGLSVKYFSYLQMTGSTVSGNSVSEGTGDTFGGEGAGGGIDIGYSSIAAIINSTISGNTASLGGGIHTQAGFGYLLNTTISDNYAKRDGGGLYLGDETFGKYYYIPSSNYVQNSIISGNTANEDGNEIANYDGDVELKYSLVGDSSETFLEAIFSATPGDVDFKYGNILTTNTYGMGVMNPSSTPLNEIIKPLSNSSSRRTQTHDLVSGSPAIDNAKDSRCDDGFIVNGKDQLGRARSDGACDIGSVEFDQETFYVIKAANGKVIVFSL